MFQSHQPIMLAEVIERLRPQPGEIALDCTLGGGHHAEAILSRLLPGGRLIGLDVDRHVLAATTARLRSAGFGPDTFSARHLDFRDLPDVLAAEGVPQLDLVLLDLGVSAMQADDSERGFNYKLPGPLDMRMNRERGEPASHLIARLDESALAALLRANADEPHAELIATLIKQQLPATTQALERCVRLGLAAVRPALTKPQLKMSVRRTFQALRITVNDELTALDTLLSHLPAIVRPGGRIAVITFHSGEDRRVKHAFRAGYRDGAYSEISRTVTRSTKAETWSNRRASSAKLRWAVR